MKKFVKTWYNNINLNLGGENVREEDCQDVIRLEERRKKPCLLVRGARQVGKTYIIDKFARDHYKSYIYINFELSPEYKTIFNGNLDIRTLMMKLEVTFPNNKIIPHKTILFLDEIQSCPNARTALKSFALDGRIDVISSGSLLGLYYKEVYLLILLVMKEL